MLQRGGLIHGPSLELHGLGLHLLGLLLPLPGDRHPVGGRPALGRLLRLPPEQAHDRLAP
jgi:hypothetical protein